MVMKRVAINLSRDLSGSSSEKSLPSDSACMPANHHSAVITVKRMDGRKMAENFFDFSPSSSRCVYMNQDSLSLSGLAVRVNACLKGVNNSKARNRRRRRRRARRGFIKTWGIEFASEKQKSTRRAPTTNGLREKEGLKPELTISI